MDEDREGAEETAFAVVRLRRFIEVVDVGGGRRCDG